MPRRIAICALLLFGCKTAEGGTKVAAPAVAGAKPAEATHGHVAPSRAAAPPLFDDLGSWHHAVRTASPEAQKYFDQGLRLMFAFNHEEGIKAFQQAAVIDPRCSMCLWGWAVALGPNINLPTDAEREKTAWDLVARARAVSPQGSEKDYVEAVAKRYANPPGADRKALDQAYADAMRGLSRKHPDDLDAAVLFAESMMDLRPWDLWTKDGRMQPGTDEILMTLESVLAREPRHPGANHFYIHATEASPHPEKALAAAGRLPSLMPGAGHIVHMPAHTYVRTGRYEAAAAANRRAIAVDKKYLAQSPAQGIYAMMYVTHNYQFLWAAASLEGRSAEAIQAARDVAARLPAEMVRGMEKDLPGIDYMLAPPLFALVRFGRWQEALAEPRPPADFRYLVAVWHFARGMALAALGRGGEARQEHSQLVTFSETLPKDAMLGPLNSAQVVFAVAAPLLAGEIELRSGRAAHAIPLLRQAVKAEDALNYDEPPPWPQPARLSLGEALLEAGKPAEAAQVFREDLQRYPENGWALFGLVQAGDAQAKERFVRAWSHADVKLERPRF
jgi:tetratricopeptide (TPR) repeat protein